MDNNDCIADNIAEKYDAHGNKWRKVYFGGGLHFENWLTQCIEIYGKENVHIEKVNCSDLKCFKESKEQAYRIWTKDKK